MANEVFKFSGARSQNYDNYLGPFLFEPYGKEMASRVPLKNVQRVLELAAGTGRVTLHLRKHLPDSVKLTASDLSPDMLEIAKNKFTKANSVEFAIADMQNLPFEDNSFDVVVCQYGIMFPPDKQKVFDEVYRVLKTNGTFLFSTWEKTDRVEIFKIIYNENVIPFFKGEDPSRFIVPFSLHDPERLKSFLVNSNFQEAKVERVVLTGIAKSAHDLVMGFFITHAIGEEVETKDSIAFKTIAEKMERDIIKRFNDKPVRCELASWFGSGVKR